MLRIHQIKMEIEHSDREIEIQLRKRLGMGASEPLSWRIARESLDLRKGQPARVVYSIDLFAGDREPKLLKKLGKDAERLEAANQTHSTESGPKGNVLQFPPVVIGFGPAGMFAAERLSRHGYTPVIIERGSRVEKRVEDIETFWSTGVLNPESNVQFGEGGAGTFSDGKLTSRSKDPRGQQVLDLLAELGAPEDIRYRQKPHIGTDVLRHVVKAMRLRIEAQGGQFLFDTKVCLIKRLPDGLFELELSNGMKMKSDVVVLAVGHSARDTFAMLHGQGVELRQKPFAVGVRIEHQQSEINLQQYSEHLEALEKRYGASEYKLTATTSGGRGVYTFCMCPGGEVVAASSEPGGVVTNGMSRRARDMENANSALLVSVTPEDFNSKHLLSGIEFQRALEAAAYELGGRTYGAPYMTVGEFLGHRPFNASDETGKIKPTYRPHPVKADFRTAMPPFLLEALQDGLTQMGQKMKAFADGDGILTAFETRSSSPVRILRDENTFESISHPGLYPCGEGAGYAGGITSSAIDGIRVAEHILTRGRPELQASWD
ncbi:NAD(P)/FAD-dependent oxidoreductase [Acidaminobacter sp.]|uniref:NAD(P)/FAD-dependent oxidoreductase n=1 Tax=Acidaminobacter sp. TaxID=1872102 RepID=UPI0025656755|nr:hypothetical protein [Acidaminobacter sp.]MDK9711980.1 hypothetical protein [Acidaminobacter sp.]